MTGLYLKLAAVGIRKNGKAYAPYILTAAVMVSVLYIIAFLSDNPLLSNMRGGDVMAKILSVGIIVMTIFSAIFLFYTNSFLIKRRKKEFGLYNILGLKKGQIARILIWEALIVYVLSMIGGLGLGILFSKLAELLATRMLHGQLHYEFSVDLLVVIIVLIVFAIIFTLILINSLRQLFFSRPIELLRGGSVGEKPPRTNVPFAVLGLLLLGGAYFMAVAIEQPVFAILAFMVAVVMVIIATYMLFIAGSVVLCAILRKNNRYYYKTEHFVSVSQMAYRMRKNGAGLASICILSTMVLVTLSSTTTLFIGVNEAVKIAHPTDIEVRVYGSNDRNENDFDLIEEKVRDVCAKNMITLENFRDEYRALVYDEMTADALELDPENDYVRTYIYAANVFPSETVSGLALGERELAFAEPYSDLMNGRASLNFKGAGEYSVKEVTLDNDFYEQLRYYTTGDQNPDPTIILFCRDREVLRKICTEQTIAYTNEDQVMIMRTTRRFGFDLPGEPTDAEVYDLIIKINDALAEPDFDDISFVTDTQADAIDVEYGLFGGLFFLGILLGGVFMLSAVLIMYYKQITEGFEDQARFEILRKVGMTREEIKSSINSQVITVFFLPLVAAGVHMTFAFPIMSKMLRVFQMNSTALFALVVVICYLIFAAIYILVYRATSKSYSAIVNK